MDGLIRQSGMILMLFYATFNMLNVLYLRAPVEFIGYILLAISSLYFLQRLTQVATRGFHLSQSELLGYFLMLLILATITAQKIFLGTYVGFDGIDTLSNISTVYVLMVIWFFAGGAAARWAWVIRLRSITRRSTRSLACLTSVTCLWRSTSSCCWRLPTPSVPRRVGWPC